MYRATGRDLEEIKKKLCTHKEMAKAKLKESIIS